MARFNIDSARKQISDSKNELKELERQMKQLGKELTKLSRVAELAERRMDDVIANASRQQKDAPTLDEYRRMETLADRAREVCINAEVLGMMLNDAAYELR